MRVALVHDYLNQWGGAERVLLTLLEMFPEADIYTLLYDEKKTHGKFKDKIKKTSFLDFSWARNHHRVFIPLMPLGVKTLRIPNEYDLIISSTAGFAKGVTYPKHIPHLSYCHTPLRYAWEEKEYLHTLLSPALTTLSKPLLAYLRSWDYEAAQKPDVILTNSNFIKDKIRNYYGRDAKVIYPPVDAKTFYPETTVVKNDSYFLAVGRLLHYKRFDLIIEAFKKLTLPLLIVGNGPEEASLKKMAAGDQNIKFSHFLPSEHDLRKLYSNARALVFPQVEDFGLVAAEATACGTPLIAYDAGGAKEIVTPENGITFSEQIPRNLIMAIQRFIVEEKKFNPKTISAEAKRFSKEQFMQGISESVQNIIKTV
jgi:glycosyltransferase involved in cell wall biosynthesis